MPADFVSCARNKGKIRRFSGPNKKFGLKAGEWVNICWDSKGSHRGETHKKKAGKWLPKRKK